MKRCAIDLLGLRKFQQEVSEVTPQMIGLWSCGNQVFIATLLSGPSMSALPIRLSWDRGSTHPDFTKRPLLTISALGPHWGVRTNVFALLNLSVERGHQNKGDILLDVCV